MRRVLPGTGIRFDPFDEFCANSPPESGGSIDGGGRRTRVVADFFMGARA